MKTCRRWGLRSSHFEVRACSELSWRLASAGPHSLSIVFRRAAELDAAPEKLDGDGDIREEVALGIAANDNAPARKPTSHSLPRRARQSGFVKDRER
jgi:hypothetical protein